MSRLTSNVASFVSNDFVWSRLLLMTLHVPQYKSLEAAVFVADVMAILELVPVVLVLMVAI